MSTPVIFIHGRRSYASSWQPWTDPSADRGNRAVAPRRPEVAATALTRLKGRNL
ncbi:hypothetical protein [Actinoplanes derwentensis]|uniref:hypothetical protein n=1 Tax=Actinoplanes derwentensis TaxID=113562 RepID=UPI0012FE3FFF|nr:hypothetical protein [Actinoplanes derwentensis]